MLFNGCEVRVNVIEKIWNVIYMTTGVWNIPCHLWNVIYMTAWVWNIPCHLGDITNSTCHGQRLFSCLFAFPVQQCGMRSYRRFVRLPV